MAKAPTPGLPGGNATWADGSRFYIPNNPYRPAHPEMFEERTRQLFGEWKQKIFDQTAMTYNVQTGKTERVKDPMYRMDLDNMIFDYREGTLTLPLLVRPDLAGKFQDGVLAGGIVADNHEATGVAARAPIGSVS